MLLVEREQDWRFSLLSVITNPNVAYILMLIGILRFVNIEFITPVSGYRGFRWYLSVIGDVLLYKCCRWVTQALLNPIGNCFDGRRGLRPELWYLRFGWRCRIYIGLIMLMDTEAPGYQIALPLIIGTSVLCCLYRHNHIHVSSRRNKPRLRDGSGCRRHRHKVVSGFGAGRVLVEGEIWQAKCASELQVGQIIRVTKLTGLSWCWGVARWDIIEI